MSGDGSSGREEQCIVNNQTQKLISLFFKKLLHFNFPFITKKRKNDVNKLQVAGQDRVSGAISALACNFSVCT